MQVVICCSKIIDLRAWEIRAAVLARYHVNPTRKRMHLVKHSLATREHHLSTNDFEVVLSPVRIEPVSAL